VETGGEILNVENGHGTGAVWWVGDVFQPQKKRKEQKLEGESGNLQGSRSQSS
jgi:hypothetical protein